MSTPITTPPPTTPTSILATIVGGVRRHPRSAVAAAGLVVSLLVFLLSVQDLRQMGNTLSTITRHGWYGMWTVGWMMAVTFHVRTLRLRHVVRGWLTGFFTAVGLILIVVWMTEWLIPTGNLRTAFIVPIVEEMGKALPLLWLAWMGLRGKIAEPSITDFVILGYAIGAGFGVHEDGLWVRSVSTGFGSSVWGVLFPTFLWKSPFVIAHAGWTAMVGLGIGLTWHFRRLKVGWLLAAVPLALAILDHIAINYRGSAEGFLRALTFDGHLPAWVLLAGFALAVVLDSRVIRQQLPELGIPDSLRMRGMLTTARALPTARTSLLAAMLLIAQRRVVNGWAHRNHRGDPATAVRAWGDALAPERAESDEAGDVDHDLPDLPDTPDLTEAPDLTDAPDHDVPDAPDLTNRP